MNMTLPKYEDGSSKNEDDLTKKIKPANSPQWLEFGPKGPQNSSVTKSPLMWPN